MYCEGGRYPILCKQCTPSNTKKPKAMFFEYFEGHIKSEKHRISTPIKDIPMLEEVIKYLNQQVAEESKGITEEKSNDEMKERKKVRRPQKSVSNEVLSNGSTTPLIPKPETRLSFDIASFIIQNNLPFSIAEKLCSFISQLAMDFPPEDLCSIEVNRKQISKLASKTIGPEIQSKYLKILEDSPYSISIDEGSLKGTIEYLAISATFFDNSSSVESKTRIIGVLPL